MTTILAGANWTMWPGLSESDVVTSDDEFRSRDHVREAYGLDGSPGPFTRTFTPISEGWVGLMIRPEGSHFSISAGYVLSFNDEQGNTLFGVAVDDQAENMFFDSPSLSEPILLGSAGSTLAEFCISFSIGPQGSFQIFKDRELVDEFSGDTQNELGGSIVECAYTGLGGAIISQNLNLSEFLISTEPTLGFKVVETQLSVASLSQWDGTPSNITSIGYASLENSLSTDNADQLVTFSRPDIPVLGEDDFVASVHFETSQLAEAGAPAPEADLLIYDGSEHGAERIQPGTSFSEFRVQWDQDPRTNEPWTEAGVNEIEVGVASRTA